ncbi:MAG: hypothetical protein CSA36_00340 [Draconibacterium sp.]|nr:MAG: hypothetical protein CSA36_00340 [Draconibacterium sp.]
MKQKTLLSIVFFFLLYATNLTAQEKNHKNRWQRFQSEKIPFLTIKLDLTPEEAQKFWPVYNEFEKERWKVQKSRRDLEMKSRNSGDKLSENEIISLTREYATSLKTEGELNEKYNEKFLKILPPKKVLILYKAENEFRVHMIRMYRDRKGNKKE